MKFFLLGFAVMTTGFLTACSSDSTNDSRKSDEAILFQTSQRNIKRCWANFGDYSYFTEYNIRSSGPSHLEVKQKGIVIYSTEEAASGGSSILNGRDIMISNLATASSGNRVFFFWSAENPEGGGVKHYVHHETVGSWIPAVCDYFYH